MTRQIRLDLEYGVPIADRTNGTGKVIQDREYTKHLILAAYNINYAKGMPPDKALEFREVTIALDAAIAGQGQLKLPESEFQGLYDEVMKVAYPPAVGITGQVVPGGQYSLAWLSPVLRAELKRAGQAEKK